MKNSKLRRALLLVACAVLLVCVSVGATLAYLTDDTDVVTNTFTVGNVKIDLDEAKVTEYGVLDGDTRVTTNTYKLVPGHHYIKDPTIHVEAGSEECYLFIKLVNPITAIEHAAVADDPDTEDVDETYNQIATQLVNNGWVALDGYENVYYNTDTVDASKSEEDIDVLVFGDFMISGTADVSSYAGQSITVQAYAVQADGFDSAAAAYAAAPLAAWASATGN